YTFIINLIFHCRPKILSFTETEDEVPKEHISHLKDICNHLMRSYGQGRCGAECKILHKQLKKLKVMKRVIMNIGGTQIYR
ncbi:hypothetical protein LINPERPRIM_LOCUS4181, partial [Linum perenne]